MFVQLFVMFYGYKDLYFKFTSFLLIIIILPIPPTYNVGNHFILFKHYFRFIEPIFYLYVTNIVYY